MIKKLLIILTTLFVFLNNARTTHIVSADLTYECLGGLSYKFTLKLYRDCAGQAIGGFQSIDFNSASLAVDSNFLLPLDTTYEVSQVCDSLLPFTTCNSGTLPGIEVYIYSANFTLPDSASDWNFENKICCRSTSITNLTAGFSFYTNTTLNNLDGKCNDSPIFQAIPLVYSCLNETIDFNNIAIDKEGDSLAFQLVRTWGDKNLNIPYSSLAFNAASPFITNTGIVFDSVTGQITFTSNSMQQVILTMLITEFDSAGNVKGTQRRDVQFILIICPPPPFNPYTTGVNFDTLNYTYTGCYNTPISFDVFSVSYDTINPIELNYFSNIPNATFTTTVNLDTTFGTFTWVPGTRLGNYYFRLQTIAKTCPLNRQNIFNYTIHIDTVFNACRDTTLYLSTSGYQVIDSSYVLDFGSSGNCPIQSVTLSKDTFDCNDLGITPVTVTTYYQNGLTRTCTANVTLIDTISPIAGCVDTTIYLDTAGTSVIDSSFVHDFSIVSCGTSTIKLSKYIFYCSDLGANTVALEVTEVGGLKDTCFGIVTVIDTFSPTAICQDTTLYLDTFGQVVIDSSYIDNGSTDNCLVVRKYLSQSSFDCTHIGTNTITLYVEDISGNIDSCQANVTILDTNALRLNCKDTTVYLSGGTVSITVTDVDAGNSSVCGSTNASLDKYVFSCLDTGANIVKLLVTNSQGDRDSCYSTVTVLDTSRVIFSCKDTTVYLNSLGYVVIDSSFVLDTFINNTCNLLGIKVSKDTFRCSDIGANMLTTEVLYLRGNNFDSCTSILTVLDTISPVSICQNISIYLNSSGTAFIDSSEINNGSTDNCAIATISLSQVSFNCGNLGVNNVVMTVTDVNGNVSTCSAIVNVIDTIKPEVICRDTTVYLSNFGTKLIDSSFVNNGSYDSCGIATIRINNNNFDCSNVGLNTVTMIVTDVNNNIDSCSAIVTVVDSTNPVANCQNLTVYLDAAGFAVIDSSDINNGSTDNCGIASIELSKDTFNCSNVGQDTIMMIVTDVNGNVDMCQSIITIVDSIKPIARCSDTVFYLGPTGQLNIGVPAVDNGSSDNCGIHSMSLSKDTFDCASVGVNAITLVVTDLSGNSDSCSSNVTILDTLRPESICKDTIIYLSQSGLFVIDSSYLNDNSTDNCGIATISISRDTFDCNAIGVNNVTMIVTDVNGNTDTCTAQVTALDTLKPIVSCINATIYLDAAGVATIDSSTIDNGTTDNCGIATISLSQDSFDCSHLGANLVTLTATDVNGNSDTCSATVFVVDTNRPIVTCKDTTIYISNLGTFTIDTSYVENGSSDNCAIDSMSLSKYVFDCNDVGQDTIQLYVYDNSGNLDSCAAIITILDTTNPEAFCSDTTIYLDALGVFVIDSTYINAAASFGCPLGSISLSRDTFDCSSIGTNNVTMIVTDLNGNSDSCVAVVTVFDTIKPTVICRNLTVYLDNNGVAVIDTSMIDDGSNDNCGIWRMELDVTTFDCSQLGSHSVTLTVTDFNGNIDSCSATVTVLDTVKPIVGCKDTIIYLSSLGTFLIDSSFVNDSSSDNCGISTITLSNYQFDCASVGMNSVVMTVTDVNGNQDSCSAIVTVIDTTSPEVFCNNNTIYLNTAGLAFISSTAVDNGSYDSCGIASVVLSKDTFDCQEVGTNSITMTVTDVNGNTDSCTSFITVLDTLKPIVNCQNITVYLDATGNIMIDSSEIDNGSSDNCGIASMTLSQNSFDCSLVGASNVTLTVIDLNGNLDSCSAIVTVLDTLKPLVICRDTTIYLGQVGNATIDSSFINNGSADNCGISTIALSQTQFGCVNVGPNSVTMIVTDVNGNIDSCQAIVTVIDTFIPVSFAGNDTNICGYLAINVNSDSVLPHQTGVWSAANPMPSLPVFTNLNDPKAGVSNLIRGTYNFIWSVSNGNGCNVTSDTVEVNILDTLFAFAGPDISLCDQYATNLMGVPTVVGSVGSWFSIAGTPTIPVIANPGLATTGVSNLSEGTFNFVWEVNNGLCVSVYDTAIIDVYDLPVSNAGLDQNLCAIYSTTMAANSPPGRASGVWTLISSTNGTIPVFSDTTSFNALLAGLSEGSYSFAWTVSNGLCAPSVDTVQINVFELPNAQAGGDSIICDLSTLQLFATTPSGTATGQWDYIPGGYVTNPVFNDSSLPNATVSSLTIGATQLLTWNVSNGTCPDDIDTVSITIQARPIVIAGNDTSICANYSVTLNALPIALPAIGFWTIDSTTAPNIPIFSNKNNPSTSVSGLIEGTYSFIWRGKNLPCFDLSDTIEISIFNQHTALVSADQLLCAHTQTMISGNSVPGTAITKWYLESSAPNVPTFDSTQNNTILGGIVPGGFYNMVWEITNGVCPVSRDTIQVVNQFVPDASFFQDVNEICQGEIVNFASTSTMTAPATIAAEVWSMNGNDYAAPFVSEQFNDPGYFDVRLIVAASNGCLDTIQKDSAVFVHTNPIADFSIDYVPNTMRIDVNDMSQFATGYNYTFGDGNTSNLSNPVYSYRDTGDFLVWQYVTNDFGCRDSISKEIYIQFITSYVPNAFTPNKD
ncbi:MAG: HYR domain-containing protein, partial [Flavobacteriales bacterium]